MEENSKKIEENGVEKLEDTFVLRFLDGTEKTIKANYGILQKIYSKFSNLEQLQQITYDFALLSEISNEFIAERDENGNKTEPDKDYLFNLDLEEGSRFNDWVSAHIINFFISRSQAQPLTNKQIGRLADLLQKAAEEAKEVSKKSKQP